MNLNKMFYKEETPVFDTLINHAKIAIKDDDVDYIEHLFISTSINFAKYCVKNNIKHIDLLMPDSNGIFFKYIKEVYGKSIS
jgi:hypothetical protein